MQFLNHNQKPTYNLACNAASDQIDGAYKARLFDLRNLTILQSSSPRCDLVIFVLQVPWLVVPFRWREISLNPGIRERGSQMVARDMVGSRDGSRCGWSEERGKGVDKEGEKREG